MSRYIKRPRPEPTDEDFLALLILLGPLAYALRWIWRGLQSTAPWAGRGWGTRT